MQLRSWVAWVVGVTVLAWSIVAVVQAQGVQIPQEALDFLNGAKGTQLDPAIVNFYEANKGLLPS